MFAGEYDFVAINCGGSYGCLTGGDPVLSGNVEEEFHCLLTRDCDFRLIIKKSKNERVLAKKFFR
jgi:hypothetical protein